MNQLCVGKVGGSPEERVESLLRSGYDSCVISEEQAADYGYQHYRVQISLVLSFSFAHGYLM